MACRSRWLRLLAPFLVLLPSRSTSAFLTGGNGGHDVTKRPMQTNSVGPAANWHKHGLVSILPGSVWGQVEIFVGPPMKYSYLARGAALFARKPTEEEMEERKEQLRVLLSASKDDIDKLVRQNPGVIIRSNIEKNHGPKLTLLQERLGISEKDAGRLLLKGNRLLKTSLATMENRMDWLQARLNLNKSQLKKIIKRNPIFLTFSIENNLDPTIDNIQTSLELSNEELTKIIVKQPDVLKFNMSDVEF